MKRKEHEQSEILKQTNPRGRQVLEIAATLRTEIVSGQLAGGQQLRQEHLAKRFGVSRMPIRDALRYLEAEGLITFQANKSAKVSPVSAADLREVCEMRIAAETLALRIAIPELTNSQIDRAAQVQAQLEAAPVAEFGALNTRFHNTLYQPCARPRLLAHIDVLSNAADRYLRIIVGVLDYAAKSHGEHHELLAACRGRDEGAALACLTKHISQAGRDLSNMLAEN